MNPYYRCFEAADGFVAVACLNLAQRQALLDFFGLADATVAAPDVTPNDPAMLARKQQLTAEIAFRISAQPVGAWVDQLGALGVPVGPCWRARPCRTTCRWMPSG